MKISSVQTHRFRAWRTSACPCWSIRLRNRAPGKEEFRRSGRPPPRSSIWTHRCLPKSAASRCRWRFRSPSRWGPGAGCRETPLSSPGACMYRVRSTRPPATARRTRRRGPSPAVRHTAAAGRRPAHRRTPPPPPGGAEVDRGRQRSWPVGQVRLGSWRRARRHRRSERGPRLPQTAESGSERVNKAGVVDFVACKGAMTKRDAEAAVGIVFASIADARRGRRRCGLRQIRATRAAGPRGPQPEHWRAHRYRPVVRGVVQGREIAEGCAELTGVDDVVAMRSGGWRRVAACRFPHPRPNRPARPAVAATGSGYHDRFRPFGGGLQTGRSRAAG